MEKYPVLYPVSWARLGLEIGLVKRLGLKINIKRVDLGQVIELVNAQFLKRGVNLELESRECVFAVRTVDIGALSDETKALEELSRQLFLESVDLHNEQVTVSSLRIYYPPLHPQNINLPASVL